MITEDKKRSRMVARLVASTMILLATACGETNAARETGSDAQALATQISTVRLRTTLVPRYLGATNGGGSTVVATATVADAWETLTLIDVNGGALTSGDLVYLRAGSGQYIRATNGGGSTIDAAASVADDFETFRIVKSTGTGVIATGDVVGLQTLLTGAFLSAEQGGGAGVMAYGTALGPWERFAIEIGVGGVTDAATRISGVTLRIGTRYLGAVNNGGGAVTATAQAASAWETFSILDVNGGTLESGDEIHVLSGNGRYLRAANGGGTTLDAGSTAQLGWETFRIVRALGAGTVVSGDTVGLQTITTNNFVSAENGGGGAVFAYGGSLGGWERFVITLGASRWVYGQEARGWRLVWSDEFDGTAIDETKWAYETQRPRWVNNELQGYTYRRGENARVEGGNLVIEARRDGFEGQEYTSARLKTAGKVAFTYGRIEARIELPSGWGTWPAFWMMPNDMHRGWPACGEIDIMEHVGYDEGAVHSTTHTLAYNWKSTQQRTSTTHVTNATTAFHTYAVEWYPERLDFFVDGTYFYTSPNDFTGDDAWPFDKDFHIILNLAVGGDWGGAMGVDPNIWPRRMRVDYVRVYQR